MEIELTYRSFGARILLKDAGILNKNEHESKTANAVFMRVQQNVAPVFFRKTCKFFYDKRY